VKTKPRGNLGGVLPGVRPKGKAIPHCVPQPKSAAQGILTISRILLPIDFSAESKNALRYAGAFARQFGACLTLLHVVEPVVCAADFGYGPVTRLYPNEELLQKARTRLRLLGKRLTPSWLRVTADVRTGVAETEIVEAARELETDLIVMGTHGDCRSGQTPIGSTAERVVRHAPCPVFVVRKKEHEFVWCRKKK
jgi:universal stress protein A